MARAAGFLLVAGLVVLAVAELCQAQLCSNCECLPEPSSHELCARRQERGSGKYRYRTFGSRCELACSNRCRNDKYVFVANGRCSEYMAASTPTSTNGGNDKRPAARPEEGSLLGSLMQAAPSS